MLNTVSTNTWGVESSQVPAGVILGVSVVVESRFPVYLTALTCDGTSISMSLSQAGEVIAHGVSDHGDDVMFLSTQGSCSYAAVEIGDITGHSIDVKHPIEINSSSVLVSRQNKYKKDSVTVRQDGVAETVELTADYRLKVDPRFTAQYDDTTATLTLSMSEESHRSLVSLFIDVYPDTGYVTTINNVKPGDDGIVHITIGNPDVTDLTFYRAENIPMLTLHSAISTCDTEDPIDKYISPTNVRNFSYMPLDEAYKLSDGVRTGERDTIKLLMEPYNKLDSNYDSANA